MGAKTKYNLKSVEAEHLGENYRPTDNEEQIKIADEIAKSEVLANESEFLENRRKQEQELIAEREKQIGDQMILEKEARKFTKTRKLTEHGREYIEEKKEAIRDYKNGALQKDTIKRSINPRKRLEMIYRGHIENDNALYGVKGVYGYFIRNGELFKIQDMTDEWFEEHIYGRRWQAMNYADEKFARGFYRKGKLYCNEPYYRCYWIGNGVGQLKPAYKYYCEKEIELFEPPFGAVREGLDLWTLIAECGYNKSYKFKYSQDGQYNTPETMFNTSPFLIKMRYFFLRCVCFLPETGICLDYPSKGIKEKLKENGEACGCWAYLFNDHPTVKMVQKYGYQNCVPDAFYKRAGLFLTKHQKIKEFVDKYLFDDIEDFNLGFFLYEYRQYTCNFEYEDCYCWNDYTKIDRYDNGRPETYREGKKATQEEIEKFKPWLCRMISRLMNRLGPHIYENQNFLVDKEPLNSIIPPCIEFSKPGAIEDFKEILELGFQCRSNTILSMFLELKDCDRFQDLITPDIAMLNGVVYTILKKRGKEFNKENLEALKYEILEKEVTKLSRWVMEYEKSVKKYEPDKSFSTISSALKHYFENTKEHQKECRLEGCLFLSAALAYIGVPYRKFNKVLHSQQFYHHRDGVLTNEMLSTKTWEYFTKGDLIWLLAGQMATVPGDIKDYTSKYYERKDYPGIKFGIELLFDYFAKELEGEDLSCNKLMKEAPEIILRSPYPKNPEKEYEDVAPVHVPMMFEACIRHRMRLAQEFKALPDKTTTEALHLEWELNAFRLQCLLQESQFQLDATDAKFYSEDRKAFYKMQYGEYYKMMEEKLSYMDDEYFENERDSIVKAFSRINAALVQQGECSPNPVEGFCYFIMNKSNEPLRYENNNDLEASQYFYHFFFKGCNPYRKGVYRSPEAQALFAEAVQNNTRFQQHFQEEKSNFLQLRRDSFLKGSFEKDILEDAVERCFVKSIPLPMIHEVIDCRYEELSSAIEKGEPIKALIDERKKEAENRTQGEFEKIMEEDFHIKLQ